MAMLVLIFILGAIAGTLVTWACMSDERHSIDPTESGVWPL